MAARDEVLATAALVGHILRMGCRHKTIRRGLFCPRQRFLARCEAVSHAWKACAAADMLWKEICASVAVGTALSSLTGVVNWKTVFRNYILADRKRTVEVELSELQFMVRLQGRHLLFNDVVQGASAEVVREPFESEALRWRMPHGLRAANSVSAGAVRLSTTWAQAADKHGWGDEAWQGGEGLCGLTSGEFFSGPDRHRFPPLEVVVFRTSDPTAHTVHALATVTVHSPHRGVCTVCTPGPIRRSSDSSRGRP